MFQFVTYTCQIGIFCRRWWSAGQNAPRHLLFESLGCQLEQVVKILSLCFVVFGWNRFEGAAKVTNEPIDGVAQIWLSLDATLMIDTVTVSTQHHLSTS